MRGNIAFTNFVYRCCHDEHPVVYGDSSKTRDFTYKDDAVRVNKQLLADDNTDGEIMYVGSTDNINSQLLAEIIPDDIEPSRDIKSQDTNTCNAE